jgi:hypothetical protein
MLKCIKNKLYRKREREEGRDEKSKQSVSGIKYLIFVRGHNSLSTNKSVPAMAGFGNFCISL